MKVADTPPVNISHVAKEACVSVGTVSRVLNGYSNISPENIMRVENAVAKLGYRPRTTRKSSNGRGNKALNGKRSLSNRKTGNIGVVFVEMGPEWVDHPLYTSYSHGIANACAEFGYHPIIEWKRDLEMPQCVLDGKVDGLLLKTTSHLPQFLSSLPSSYPVVSIGTNDPLSNVEQVMADEHGAGWSAAQYLWGCGHRKIAFISNHSNHPFLFSRYQGYQFFMHENDAYDPELVSLKRTPSNNAKPSLAFPDMSPHLDLICSGKFTAVIVPNDWMAAGLVREFKKQGIRVPEDVSIVGVDNVRAVCEMVEPALTSYEIPFTEIAYQGALALFNRIESSNGRANQTFSAVRGRLIERQSVRTIE